MSQNGGGERSLYVNATDEIERLLEAEYARVARLIARVIRDPGRAEELAVEVFLRYAPGRVAEGATQEGWLCVTAARMALDELRRQAREHTPNGSKTKFETLVAADGGARLGA